MLMRRILSWQQAQNVRLSGESLSELVQFGSIRSEARSSVTPSLNHDLSLCEAYNFLGLSSMIGRLW